MTNLIMKSLSQLHRDEAGQGLVEYALIIALVAFAAVVGMNTLATAHSAKSARCSTLASRRFGRTTFGLSWFLRSVSRGNPDQRN